VPNQFVELESIRYINLPATRFIGKGVMASGPDAGQKYGEMWGKSGEFMPALDGMTDCTTDIADPCALTHFSNRKHDEAGGDMHYIVGKFMKAGTPVPEGLDFWDMAPTTVGLAVVRGEFNDIIDNAMMMSHDKIVSDGYAITYPDNYFHAEVYTKENIPKEGIVSKLGYLHACKKMAT